MTESNPIADDLRFVRRAVEARDRPPGRPAWQIQCYWAAYVLTGYTLVDFRPGAAGGFFLPGAAIGFLASWHFGKRAALRRGVADARAGRRIMLFWAGGFILSIGALIGMACVMPALRNDTGGRILSQILVILFGLQYFYFGVLVPEARHLRWAGPVMIAGGVCVGMVPSHGWTALGVVIAAALLTPLLSRAGTADHP
jgi:hypothetical protein